MSAPRLVVENLEVRTAGGIPVVQDVGFSLDAGKVLAIVGESGSGKTTLGLALLGYARHRGRITGRIAINGTDVLGSRRLRHMRGGLISYVPQDPSMALNPSMRVAQALEDVLRAHGATQDVGARIGELLDLVQLPREAWFRDRYPHQLSGGQQQRVSIALALACDPAVTVMDEPTTALDVVTQRELLTGIAELRRRIGLTIVYVSHDLSVVAGIADRIAVAYAGRIVEEAPTETILRQPRHPYTRGLIAAVPDLRRPQPPRGVPGVAVGIGAWPPGCPFAPRCDLRTGECETGLPPLTSLIPDHRVRCIRSEIIRRVEPIPARALPDTRTEQRPMLSVRSLTARHGRGAYAVLAADNVSFDVSQGTCLALVGQSGSGKTTVTRCVAGLHTPASGSILLDGEVLAGDVRHRSPAHRRRIQMIFQNPRDSLNPRRRIIDIVARPSVLLLGRSARDARASALALLEQVRLPRRVASLYPAELSGGELQRAAIARAIACKPDLLVCDEITSALDVSMQAVVTQMLLDIRDEMGLTLLFVTHDLGVVASIADAVVVLHHGRISEGGSTASVLTQPDSAYTRLLVEAAPSLTRALEHAHAAE